MKFIFKIILQYYLKYLTKLVLIFHRPIVIAVIGSTNKTFIKEEINRQLKQKNFSVRANPKSFNTEIGLPLAILNLPSGYNLYLAWLPIIFQAFFAIFDFNFPKILILELGVSVPGDIKYLLGIFKPKIAIVADINQRYLESFADMDELMGEYEELVKNLPKTGLAILNYDNTRVRSLAKLARAKVNFFGLTSTQPSASEYWQITKISKTTTGQIAEVKHGDQITTYQLNRFGQHHLYVLLATLAAVDYLPRYLKRPAVK